jgi:hypothetical protein
MFDDFSSFNTAMVSGISDTGNGDFSFDPTGADFTAIPSLDPNDPLFDNNFNPTTIDPTTIDITNEATMPNFDDFTMDQIELLTPEMKEIMEFQCMEATPETDYFKAEGKPRQLNFIFTGLTDCAETEVDHDGFMTCKTCAATKMKINGMCLAGCPAGSIEDIANAGNCIICGPGCKTCDGTGCLTCDLGAGYVHDAPPNNAPKVCN